MSRFSSCLTLHLLIVGIVSGGVLAASPSIARAADDDDYRDAVGFYNINRWQSAADSFKKFLKEHPTHRQAENASYYLGLTLINLEDHKQARESLRAYAKNFPKGRYAVPALYWIGQSSYLVGDLPAARTELQSYVEKAGNDPLLERALPYLGEVLVRTQSPDKAEAHLRRALELFPKGALAEDAKYNLGRAYELQNKPKEARELFSELAANRMGERAADAQFRLGWIAFDEGDFQGAEAAYTQLAERFPESPLLPLASLNRGLALYQLQRYADAVTEFDKVADDAKQGTEATFWKGMSLKLSDKPEEAAAVFEKSVAALKDQPEAERSLYQWGQCLQKMSKWEEARNIYIQVADRFPKGNLADQSLHYACVTALTEGKLEVCNQLLERFEKQFPGNKLRHWQEILRARLALAVFAQTKEPPQLDAAQVSLEAVIRDSTIENTRHHARFYLASVLQSKGEYKKLLEASEPVATALAADPGLSELADILVLRASAALILGRKAALEQGADKQQFFNTSAGAAEAYLKLPEGALTDQALSLLSMAEAHRSNKPAALTALRTLTEKYPESPYIDETLIEQNLIAYSSEDWTWAESAAVQLAARPKPESKARGLVEAGWAQYRQKRLGDAAGTWGRLVQEFPEDSHVAEAESMQAAALLESGDATAALPLYQDVFKRFGTTTEAYTCGLQAGRILGRAKQTKESAAAFTALLERFPNHPDADKILDEWAGFHVIAEDFATADDIYRRLIKEHPQSSLADNSRLALAESDLVSQDNARIAAAFTELQALTKDPAADDEVKQRAGYQMLQVLIVQAKWKELAAACEALLAAYPTGQFHWEADFHLAEADFQLEAYEKALARVTRLQGGQPATGSADEKDLAALKDADWYPRLWVIAAECQFHQKKYDEVERTLADFRLKFTKSPFQYFIVEILGRSYKAQARFEEAREAFDRVIQDEFGARTETAAKSHFLMAETLLQEKNFARAATEYEKVEIRYDFPEWQGLALFQAGECYKSLERWQEAAESYERLIKKFPKHEMVAKAREPLAAVKKKLAGG